MWNPRIKALYCYFWCACVILVHPIFSACQCLYISLPMELFFNCIWVETRYVYSESTIYLRNKTSPSVLTNEVQSHAIQASFQLFNQIYYTLLIIKLPPQWQNLTWWGSTLSWCCEILACSCWGPWHSPPASLRTTWPLLVFAPSLPFSIVLYRLVLVGGHRKQTIQYLKSKKFW